MFIYRSLDDVSVKPKMLYAASKDAVKKTLKDGLSKTVQVNEIEELRKVLLYHDERKMWSWKPGIFLREGVSSDMINIVIDVDLYFELVIAIELMRNRKCQIGNKICISLKGICYAQ